ncbi:MAG: hypothetical protein FRX49_08310 [Trebouxia sp. A1-2]|nr:MAG: hypothetical protein FRX49_08310 [Trebouxia sp. A1-2]
MCTSLFLWDQHPTLLFLLAFNRDEFLARKTEPAQFWLDWPNLLAGRDEERGGTWLGMTTGGRFAMLTNFREVAHDVVKYAPSRGALTTDFLKGQSQPLQYLEGLQAEAYNGFNLIVGDFQQHKLAYFSNRSGQAPHELSPGLYGISNGVLESKWPKVEAGKARLRFLLDQTTNVQQLDAETVFQTVMGDTAKVNQNEHLPQTGMSVEIEQLMSSIFIEPCELKGAAYGTRSQTLLLVQRDGVAQLHEHSRPAQRPEEDSCFPWVKVNHTFSWG